MVGTFGVRIRNTGQDDDAVLVTTWCCYTVMNAGTLYAAKLFVSFTFHVWTLWVWLTQSPTRTWFSRDGWNLTHLCVNAMNVSCPYARAHFMLIIVCGHTLVCDDPGVCLWVPIANKFDP